MTQTSGISSPVVAEANAAAASVKGARNANPPGISLWALLHEDLRTHEGNIFEQGFWAVAVHRFGNWRMGRIKIIRAPMTLVYRVLFKMTEIAAGISLPYSVPIGRRVRIWHHSGILINAESIGDDVHIRQNTTIGVARRDNRARPRIGNRVDIGCGACILGDITVGDDAVIGANAVVVRDVPARAVVGGVPAKLLRMRSPEELEATPR